MKYLVKFFVIILITFCITIVNAEVSIVYINMEKVMNKTIAGESIVQQLEKIHKKNIEEFKKIDKIVHRKITSQLSNMDSSIRNIHF